jgi:hypothetical protein
MRRNERKCTLCSEKPANSWPTPWRTILQRLVSGALRRVEARSRRNARAGALRIQASAIRARVASRHQQLKPMRLAHRSIAAPAAGRTHAAEERQRAACRVARGKVLRLLWRSTGSTSSTSAGSHLENFGTVPAPATVTATLRARVKHSKSLQKLSAVHRAA